MCQSALLGIKGLRTGQVSYLKYLKVNHFYTVLTENDFILQQYVLLEKVLEPSCFLTITLYTVIVALNYPVFQHLFFTVMESFWVPKSKLKNSKLKHTRATFTLPMRKCRKGIIAGSNIIL